MIPTFSDRGTTAGARAFRRGLWSTIALLGVVAFGAGLMTLTQGPQLRSITLDETSSIRSAGEITLRSDRALASVPQTSIRINPAIPFTVTQKDLDLRLILDEPLLAGTDYEIEIDGVEPASLGASGSWATSFSTPSEGLAYLRAAGVDTELVRLVLDGSRPEVIYRAPGITSFAPVGAVFAVHRIWAGESLLELVEPSSGAVDRMALGPDVIVTGLANASWGTSLIIKLDRKVEGKPEKGILALVDTLGSRTPEIVLGPDGDSLGVGKVAVSSVSGNIIVWLRDSSLVLFEPLTQTVIPLGSAAELWGFNSSGTSVIFVDALGTIALDVATRVETRIPVGQLEGYSVFHQLTTLSPQGLSYQRVLFPSVVGGPDFSLVTEGDAEGFHRHLLGSLSTPESVGDLQLSPNGQYLAVEINPIATALGYPGLSDDLIRASTELVILDLAQDTVLLATPGFSFAW